MANSDAPIVSEPKKEPAREDLKEVVLSKPVKERLRREVAVAIRNEVFSGPIPHPETLAAYERVYPGAAKIICDDFQTNSEHIRSLNKESFIAHKEEIEKNRAAAERLLWGMLIATVVLALTGHDWVAGILATTSIGTIVGGFLLKRKARSNTSNRPNE